MIERLGTETGRMILAKFGLEKTLYHFCEECAELYAEVCHYDIRSDRNEDNTKLQEEIADVFILFDDLWDFIGDEVEPKYTEIDKEGSCKTEPEEYPSELLYRLARCIYYVTDEVQCLRSMDSLEDFFIDSNTYWDIAAMLWTLEQYKKFHETGFDEVFKRKLQKRALRLNISVQA